MHRTFLLIAALFSTVAVADDRPNVLIVLMDDLRWDELGCTGHPFVKTPHIDSLAARGVRNMDAGEERIADEGLAGQLRLKARSINRRALITAILITLLALAFPAR